MPNENGSLYGLTILCQSEVEGILESTGGAVIVGAQNASAVMAGEQYELRLRERPLGMIALSLVDPR